MSYSLQMDQDNLQKIASQYAALSTEIVEAEREIAALDGQKSALLSPIFEKRKRHGELKTILDFLQSNLKEDKTEEVTAVPDMLPPVSPTLKPMDRPK